MEQQTRFEDQQREYEKNSEEIDAAERKKMTILNWAVIAATFILVVFLMWKLLF